VSAVQAQAAELTRITLLRARAANLADDGANKNDLRRTRKAGAAFRRSFPLAAVLKRALEGVAIAAPQEGLQLAEVHVGGIYGA
jgi:hypothetical protein